MDEKKILVLGRRDHTEAMRVAAGLTIFGHEVRLVFMTEPVADSEETRRRPSFWSSATSCPRPPSRIWPKT